jgi:hypothetical protein
MTTTRSASLPTVPGWIGLVLHVAVGAFPYAASGLLAPAGGVALLAAVWLGLAVLAVRLRRSRWALAVPPAALALWPAVMLIGDQLLGWTA